MAKQKNEKIENDVDDQWLYDAAFGSKKWDRILGAGPLRSEIAWSYVRAVRTLQQLEARIDAFVDEDGAEEVYHNRPQLNTQRSRLIRAVAAYAQLFDQWLKDHEENPPYSSGYGGGY